MSIEANWQRGERYYYASADVLACIFIGLETKGVMLHTKRPKEGRYHRVKLDVVRTKKEARAMNARLTKARKRIEATIAKTEPTP